MIARLCYQVVYMLATYHAAALLIHRVSEWSKKAALLLFSVRL